MKKLLFVLFLVLSVNALANDSLMAFLKDQKIDLNQGVILKEHVPLNDFSTLYSTNIFPVKLRASDFGWYNEAYGDSWYHTDFAAEPFDGLIEVLVVGEPLPSTTITFIISVLVCLLLLKNKIGLLKC